MELERYGFLFALAIIWTVFATVQDLRKREVANWLNFSLVGFALAYRVFYSAAFNDWNFVWFGILGFALFLGLGNLFYYSRMFAGGDAKLLMGLGLILPFERYFDLFYVSIVFILILFMAGMIYSLIYTVFLVFKNKPMFISEFRKNWKKKKLLFLVSCVFGTLFLLSFIFFRFDALLSALVILFVFFMPGLYIYLKSLDRCMIRLVAPENLTEGDWLEKAVKIGRFSVRKSVHGLSVEDILRLRKARKSVFIKEGIPFVPAFLIALLIMVSFLAVSGLGFFPGPLF